MFISPLPPERVRNLHRMHELRDAALADDAESLALMIEDECIEDDGTVGGRVEALILASEHRWVPGFRLPLDVPGLCELKGFSDVGFRDEFRDPWPQSREQVGHFLTSVGLVRLPGVVRTRRFGLRLRDLSGAPRWMSDAEVALRLMIGHEKAPDPRPTEPLILLKIRRQFASATDADVVLFREAVDELAESHDLRLDRIARHVAAIEVGSGVGNSAADLLLGLAGAHFASLVDRDAFLGRRGAADWVRTNVKASAG